jgi:hypothetical protein
MLNKVANWVAEDGGRGEALLTNQDIELIQA